MHGMRHPSSDCRPDWICSSGLVVADLVSLSVGAPLAPLSREWE
jgi:hypothetical protein